MYGLDTTVHVNKMVEGCGLMHNRVFKDCTRDEYFTRSIMFMRSPNIITDDYYK